MLFDCCGMVICCIKCRVMDMSHFARKLLRLCARKGIDMEFSAGHLLGICCSQLGKLFFGLRYRNLLNNE